MISSEKKYYAAIIGQPLNSYFTQKNYDIYITGSNSKLLSGELATYLSGRYVKLNIYPFSFKEYVEYFKIKSDFKTHFYNYLKEGGMPSTFNYENGEKKLLQEIYMTPLFLKTSSAETMLKILIY